MSELALRNWDDAYVNSAYIKDGPSFPARWTELAGKFREKTLADGRAKLDLPYGPRPRNRIDLFTPTGKVRGLAIFVHGGYWLAFDKSNWSHLANGALEQGFAVALPGYTLAPEVSVSEITRETGMAITHLASLIAGPIHLAGHSAGGHLVSRMACRNAPLSAEVKSRITKITSISGVHDLRPLTRTAMGSKLFRDEQEAAIESPCLLEPEQGINIACWVGADERPEFLRQNELLANIWAGFDVTTRSIVVPGRHHFDVIDDLTDAASRLTAEFTNG